MVSHVRLELIITPKNWVLWTWTITILSINTFKFPVFFILFFITKHYKVSFLMFNESLFNLNHLDIFWSSLLTFTNSSFIFACWKNRFVSSANMINSAHFDILVMPLIKRMNNKGPNMEPWGTPLATGSIFELTLTVLLMIFNDIAFDSGSTMAACLLDLSAAFDTVDHGILLPRLKKLRLLRIDFGMVGHISSQ